MSGPKKPQPVQGPGISRVDFSEREAGKIQVARKKPTEAELRESAKQLEKKVSGGDQKGGVIRLPNTKKVEIRGQEYDVLFLRPDAPLEKRLEALKQGWQQVNPRDVSVQGFIYARPENHGIVKQFIDEGGGFNLW